MNSTTVDGRPGPDGDVIFARRINHKTVIIHPSTKRQDAKTAGIIAVTPRNAAGARNMEFARP